VARAVMARATHAAGDTAGALAHAEEALAALSAHAVEEGEALIQLVHAEALLASGRAAEARACASRAAARLEERARRIKDLEWRDELLRCVPTHARILELARRD
jgi:hypothetical protein